MSIVDEENEPLFSADEVDEGEAPFGKGRGVAPKGRLFQRRKFLRSHTPYYHPHDIEYTMIGSTNT
jgi:hypothetical protein